MKLYTHKEAAEELSHLDLAWCITQDGIQKTIEFENFINAFAFLAKVALIAESKNHHPKIINEYNKVSISFYSNEAKGITEQDFEIVKVINKLIKNENSSVCREQ